MISCRKNCKEIKGKSFGARKCKIGEKTRVCEISQPKRSLCGIATLLRNNFAPSGPSLQKFSQLRSTLLAHECHFAAQFPPFRSYEMGCKNDPWYYFIFIKIGHLSCQKGSERKNTRATIRSLSHLSLKPREPLAIISGQFLQSAMARTRGAKSSFPLGRKRVAREAPIQGSKSEPPRQVAAPPPIEPAPLSPSGRRYQTRSGRCPPQKKASVVDSEPIDFPEPVLEPSPTPSSEPPAEPQPPIEGNLDCQARPFHSELCFDTATFRLQPEWLLLKKCYSIACN